MSLHARVTLPVRAPKQKETRTSSLAPCRPLECYPARDRNNRPKDTKLSDKTRTKLHTSENPRSVQNWETQRQGEDLWVLGASSLDGAQTVTVAVQLV